VTKRDKCDLTRQEASVLRVTIRAELQAGNEELMEEDKFLLQYSIDTILVWNGDKEKMWVHAVKVVRAISRGEIATP